MDLSAQQLDALNDQLRQELGLDINPFLPTLSCFYDGAQRQHNIETLRHLSIFGDMLLLLTGASGAGKTCLLEEFSRRHSDEVNILMLSAFSGTTNESCIARLTSLSGLQRLEKESPIQMLERLVQKFQVDYKATGKRTVWVVDDADQLPSGELKMMFAAVDSLPAESGLVLLLAGSTDLTARIQSVLSTEQHAQVHQIVLKPFSGEEISEYLALRMKAAGYSGNIELSVQKIDDLMRFSGGLPGVLHRYFSSVWLGVQEQADVSDEDRPAVVNRVLFGIAGLLLLSFLLVSYQHGLFDSQEPVGLARQEINQKTFENERAEKAEARDRAAEEVAARLAMLDRAIEAQSAGMKENASLPKLSINSDESADTSEELGVNKGVGEHDVEVVVLAETNSEQVFSAESFNSGADASSSDVQPAESKDAIELAQTSENPISVKQGGVDQGGSNQKAVEPENPKHSNFRSSRWVKENVGRYTLQVLGSYNESAASAFSENVPNAGGQLVYIETVYKSRPWFVVLYGRFDTKDAARLAVKQAPTKIQKQKPWLRSFAAIEESLPQ